MVNYYQILKVSPKATNAEIKSAYRRLARKVHPDVNTTHAPENASGEFAKIAKAYELLSNPKERAAYDRQLLNAQYKKSAINDSVFSSENAHARRWRQMAYERRYNEIIDRMIADERRETMALQKVIFPTVALFLSTCFVGIFKPMFWANLQLIGKIVLFALFIVGIVHLFKRLRAGFERYTYRDENLHDSILEEIEQVKKPYTRFAAICFLVVGIGASLGVGLLIGHFFEAMITPSMPKIFSTNLRPEFVVDLMHSLASKFDY
jgi:curved DNA-binding protein CbpA